MIEYSFLTYISACRSHTPTLELRCFLVFVSIRMMSEQFVSTIQLCEEVGFSRGTLDKLRRDGVLIPGRDFYRGHGRRAPMF